MVCIKVHIFESRVRIPQRKKCLVKTLTKGAYSKLFYGVLKDGGSNPPEHLVKGENENDGLFKERS